MESVLSGTESNFGTFTEVDEKKTCFFFEEAEGRREKKLVFRGDRRLKVSKLDCGPERTDSILLVRKNAMGKYKIVSVLRSLDHFLLKQIELV